MSISFITLTNNGYLDYTLNCYKSLENINFDIPLKSYAIGVNAYEKLNGLKKSVEQIHDEENTTFETYRQGKWSYITYYKFEVIYKNLLSSDFVCFTDGDIVFQNKDFMDFLRGEIGNYDLLIQHDYPHELCSGFMFIKSNANTLNYFNPKNIPFQSDPKWDDQVYINKIKNNIHYKLLPIEYFPNGHYYYKNYKKINPYLIHFNCVLGHEKKERMIKHNKWYLQYF